MCVSGFPEGLESWTGRDGQKSGTNEENRIRIHSHLTLIEIGKGRRAESDQR